MSQGLLKETSKKTAAELMEQIESVGGSIDAYAGNNSFGISLECMQSDAQMALDCLREVLQDPTFPEEEIERERQVQLAGIQAQRDQLLGRCLHNSCEGAVWGSILWDDFFGSGGDRLFLYT